MQNDVYKKLSQTYCPRFGKIAVEMGFVTAKQLKDALSEQADDDLANKSHRLMGRIFYEKGWMSHDEIERVLKKLFSG